MIRIENISKSFDKSNVLIEVSAVFAEAKTNLIIGRSGSGRKTVSAEMPDWLV